MEWLIPIVFLSIVLLGVWLDCREIGNNEVDVEGE